METLKVGDQTWRCLDINNLLVISVDCSKRMLNELKQDSYSVFEICSLKNLINRYLS